MKNTKQAIALASAAALSVGMLAGCGGAASSAATASSESNSTATAEASTTAASDGTLVLAETGFESKFSPFFAASAADQDVIDLTQIALLGADRKGEMVLNGIEGETREYNGTDYTYHGPADCVVTENADGTVTYDIKLREDLKFSDGEPVTIDDVIFSMYVFLDPTYDGSVTMYSTPIVGLDEYRSSMTTLSKLIAEAGEDNTDNTKFTAEQQKAFWDAVNDVEVVTHEAGHAFAAYMNRDRIPYSYVWPSMEACEVHSMSMEFFAWPWADGFFGADARKFRYSHLAGALTFIPYGTMVDHFQHIVYEHPELTPAQRHEEWKKLAAIYQPWMRLDGEIPFYGAGEYWQRQMHIYQSPFYYIDYCLAQTVSLQFWAMLQKDRADAWSHYMAYTKQGGSRTFTELLKNAGLTTPFEESCLRGVSEAAKAWLDSYDLTGIL